MARSNTSRLLITAVSNCRGLRWKAPIPRRAAQNAWRPVHQSWQLYSLWRAQLPGAQSTGCRQGQGRNRRSFISKGLFLHLAIENANREDYITEKLGRALLYGVVPVVFDAPQSLAGGPTVESGAPRFLDTPRRCRLAPTLILPTIRMQEALAAHLKHVTQQCDRVQCVLLAAPRREKASRSSSSARPQHVDLDKSGRRSEDDTPQPERAPRVPARDRGATAATRGGGEGHADAAARARYGLPAAKPAPSILFEGRRYASPAVLATAYGRSRSRKATKGNRYGSVK